MIIKLKEETLKDIKENSFFTSDGCACGDFAYQLNENLWVTAYRSCRKASGTPEEKLWELHDLEFYDDIKFSYYERDGKKLFDGIDEYGNVIENVKLNKEDTKAIYNHLRHITKVMWGNEYRNED